MNKLPQKAVIMGFFGRLEFGDCMYRLLRWSLLPHRNTVLESLLAKGLQQYFFLTHGQVYSRGNQVFSNVLFCFLMRIPDPTELDNSLILSLVFLLSYLYILSPKKPSVTTGLIPV